MLWPAACFVILRPASVAKTVFCCQCKLPCNAKICLRGMGVSEKNVTVFKSQRQAMAQTQCQTNFPHPKMHLSCFFLSLPLMWVSSQPSMHSHDVRRVLIAGSQAMEILCHCCNPVTSFYNCHKLKQFFSVPLFFQSLCSSLPNNPWAWFWFLSLVALSLMSFDYLWLRLRFCLCLAFPAKVIEVLGRCDMKPACWIVLTVSASCRLIWPHTRADDLIQKACPCSVALDERANSINFTSLGVSKGSATMTVAVLKVWRRWEFHTISQAIHSNS